MSMTTSMFASYVNKYFKGIVGKFTELYNDKKNEPTFMYEEMLDKEYSADLTWNSSSLNHSIVAADVVSMDSSLPLKKRGTIRTASGDIAKLGIKYQLNEKSISDINVMAAKGQREAEIARKILNNVPNVIRGIKTRIEIMFEQALSSGVVLVETDNEGTGVRADFGYEAAKTFHATAARWADASNAVPLTDLRQMFNSANDNGDEINYVFLSEQYFNYMRKTAEVKELVATANNQVIISASTLPQPGRQRTLDALRDEFNAEFRIVNGSFKYENRDGSQVSVKPWAQANIVGVQDLKVGRLVHGTLAEDMNRVAGVTYEKSDFILVSEYSHNEPSLAEFTAGQALAMPVIDDGNFVYVLHADGTGVVSVDPTTLSFTASANNVGKKVTVHSDYAFTAAVPEADTWCTVTTSGNEVTVKVAANSGSGATARTSTLTVTDSEGNTATVAISQAA